jgi:predicted Holliday junction resolvase-like endonuclease
VSTGLKNKKEGKMDNKRVEEVWVDQKLSVTMKAMGLGMALIMRDSATSEVKRLEDELERQFAKLEEEVKEVEKNRPLTPEEEEYYVNQILKIAEDIENKMEELRRKS